MLRTLAVSVTLTAAVLAAPGVEETSRVEFLGDWKDNENFSGLARVGNRVLVAADETAFLQVGRLNAAGSTVTLESEIELIDDDVELDIEALAANGDTVYALGSHSWTRARSDRRSRTAEENRKRLARDVEENEARDVLIRFRFDADSGTAHDLDTTSLRAFIDEHDILGPFATHAGKENGIDLEGLAVDGTTLFAGFRGPVLRHGFVPVLRFTFDAPGKASMLFVPLDGRGIRDMAKVDGGLLLLAGPVGDSDVPHRLYLWNAKDCVPGSGGAGGSLRWLGDVPPPSSVSAQERAGAKAEGMLLLREEPGHYEVLLVFDSVENGGGTRYRVPRAAAGATPSTGLCGAGH